MRRALALSACAVLAACGQKGPLYLPQKKPVVVRPAETPAATPAAPDTGAPPKKKTDDDGADAPQP